MSRVPTPFWFAASFSVLACAPGLPRPTAAHLAEAQKTEPNATLEDLSRGRTVYAAKCGNCHVLHEPGSLPPEKWQPVVAEMQEKQNVRLSPEEKRDVLRYLEAVASVSAPRN